MRYVCTVLSLSIFSFNLLFGQTQRDTTAARLLLKEATDLERQYRPKDAIPVLYNALEIYLSVCGEISKETAKIYYHLGSCYLDVAEYSKALNYLQRALEIMQATLPEDAKEIGDAYVLIGIYYDYMADYDRAIEYYEQALILYKKTLSDDDPRIGVTHNNIAICLNYKGDIARSLNFFRNTSSITINSFGGEYYKMASDFNNIATCYYQKKEFVKAKNAIDFAYVINNRHGLISSSQGARIIYTQGLIFHGLKNYKKAMQHFREALAIRLEVLGENHPEVASNYYAMADSQLEMGAIVEAKAYYEKAHRTNHAIFGDEHPETAICLAKIAEIRFLQNEPTIALKKINFALDAFGYQPRQLDFKANYNVQILEALDIKARIHWEMYRKQSSDHLLLANEAYTHLIDLLNKFRSEFQEETSKEILAERYQHIFNDAIEVSYALFLQTQNEKYLHEAFRRCEYSSSFVLLEALRLSKAKRFAGIPEDLIEKETKIKTDITTYEKLKNEEEQKIIEQRDLTSLARYNSNIFDLKQQLNQLIAHFEENYPQYYQLKYDLSTIQIAEIQDIIDSDQAILEYFVGEEAVFLFLIKKDQFQVKRLAKSYPLEEWVTALREGIIRFQYPFNLPSEYHLDYTIAAFDLYQELIMPVKEDLPERLIIIPGSILAGIPFESFLMSPPEVTHLYKNHAYLIRDYAVSYCYSSTLLKEMIDKRDDIAEESFIAFAPSFGTITRSFHLRSTRLTPLVYNIPEAESVSATLGRGTVISGRKATEDEFTNLSKKHQIIHLATHGKADDVDGDYSFLAFSEVYDTIENEYLFTKDIYNVALRADMVTLSACETGIGELREGEGVISLARSFSYAGAGCINTTLWKVADDKALLMMELFYDEIQDGYPKDIANQRAKLNYLSLADHHDAHPFLWSPFITIGDTQAIHAQLGYHRWWWIGLVLFSFGFYQWYKKS